jgi:hypothetical protein
VTLQAESDVELGIDGEGVEAFVGEAVIGTHLLPVPRGLGAVEVVDFAAL